MLGTRSTGGGEGGEGGKGGRKIVMACTTTVIVFRQPHVTVIVVLYPTKSTWFRVLSLSWLLLYSVENT